MDEAVPTIPPIPTEEPPQVPHVSPAPKINWLISLVFLIVGIAVGVTGLWSYQNFLSNRTVQPSPTPTATPDPMANWKTYINTSAGYSVKYPQDWRIESVAADSQDQQAISESRYIQIWKYSGDPKIATGVFGIEELQILPPSEEKNLTTEKVVGGIVLKCNGNFTNDTKTWCWVKVPNEEKYLNIQIFKGQDESINQNFDQILSTFKLIGNKTTLSDALTNSCIGNKISLDKLPFTLNQTVKSAYHVTNSINCFVPDDNYATMSTRINMSDFSSSNRTVYFFHQNSKWLGYGNNFQALSNYHPITINGQNYWLEIMEPGPYGISTLGLWVQIIGEKRDSASGTIVRVFDFEELKNQDLLDLMKKYGEKYPNEQDPEAPEYVIQDANKKVQFINELVNLVSQHSAFKKPAQNVTSDLNGISF